MADNVIPFPPSPALAEAVTRELAKTHPGQVKIVELMIEETLASVGTLRTVAVLEATCSWLRFVGEPESAVRGIFEGVMTRIYGGDTT